MLLAIPQLLDADALGDVRRSIEGGEWRDGKVTAGVQSALAKHNLQLALDSDGARAAGQRILDALAGNGLFQSAALPRRIVPPLFNRYDALPGHRFSDHVDNALRPLATGGRIRTDLSITVFLTDPAQYDGGELVIEDSYGAHEVKLEAGDAILYPSSSLHRVEPVTRGSRVSSFFWVESMVREDSQRTLLLDMDAAIRTLAAEVGDDHRAVVSLTGSYQNLLRRWADA